MISITPATDQDADALLELTRQLGYPSRAGEIQVRIRDILGARGHALLVARLPGGAPCGWIHLRVELSLGSDPRLEVAGLVVDESHRSRGIGARLMAAAEDQARAQGLKLVRLRSNVSRAEAHRFYARQGYEIQKTSHLFVKTIQ